MSPKVAEDMRWHEEVRTKDGVLRHPIDSKAWKHFDMMNPTFAAELRNVRVALASDGFSLFSSMTNPHSTWHVVVIPYNLPPWLCMKQPHMILSLPISGPRSLGNDIDVFLRPLVDEFKELWEEGVDTYDASRKERFKLRAGVLWTISDFLGLAMLSGWSTKEKEACPTCHEHTCHKYLKNGRKICYMGHRRFLPLNHKFRKLKKDFDGNVELRTAPNLLLGNDILQKLNDILHVFGKHFEQCLRGVNSCKRKARGTYSSQGMPNNWKKLSILYEKNVCDNVVGIIMDLDGKSKDSLKARFDLEELGVRPELHAKKLSGESNKYQIPPACYSMDNAIKEMFCKVLKSVKIPDGYSYNFARCVNVKQRKIFGLKSHDSHVIMQQFLPLAIRKTLPKKVISILIELRSFFRELCSKVNRPEDFQRLEERILLILCNLECIFPPAFFDIMVHLPIHLASEARIGGPVHFRWMYPVERYLYTLKSYVRNRAHPEGSIAEGYCSDECITFFTRYLENVETRLTRPPRYQEDKPIGGVQRFMLTHEEKALVHNYNLFNDENVSFYIE